MLTYFVACSDTFNKRVVLLQLILGPLPYSFFIVQHFVTFCYIDKVTHLLTYLTASCGEQLVASHQLFLFSVICTGRRSPKNTVQESRFVFALQRFMCPACALSLLSIFIRNMFKATATGFSLHSLDRLSAIGCFHHGNHTCNMPFLTSTHSFTVALHRS